ncbi:hypothetical protein LCGC14_0676330 [marine sediment metagenome]|uniref:Uncharacterized protein n=1 Tax=marine sediment metagenome TaxID=412755 RepID=A0A0F9TAY0_9ZZZZ
MFRQELAYLANALGISGQTGIQNLVTVAEIDTYYRFDIPCFAVIYAHNCIDIGKAKNLDPELGYQFH